MNESSVEYLTLDEVKEICFSLVEHLLQFEEPLPEFTTRFPEKLESILETPKQAVGKIDLYPTLFEKAACYFYFTIKNHPFLNGNKRMAIVTTYVFLRINGYQLRVPWREMYEFAIKIAGSTKNHKREFREVVKFILSHSEKRTD